MSCLAHIERKMHNYRVLSPEELATNYPAVSSELLLAMETEFEKDNSNIYGFFYIRQNASGESYADIYIYDTMLKCDFHRFVIQPNYVLSEEEEELYSSYAKSPLLTVGVDNLKCFIKEAQEHFPGIHMLDYYKIKKNNGNCCVGQALEHVYYTMHYGAKEILYKAGLNNLAYNFEDLYSYNWIGNSPSEIFNLPLKLLRIINDNNLTEKLATEWEIDELRRVYKLFAEVINEECPSRNQWSYLRRISEDEANAKTKYNKKLYHFFLDSEFEDDEYDTFEKFFENKKMLSDYYPVSLDTNEVYQDLKNQQSLLRLLKYEQIINAEILRRNEQCSFEYEDNEIVAVVPNTIKQFSREAAAQKNCLITYINDVANGETHIVFLRKKSKPNKSYITVEIRNGGVYQAYGACNKNLTPEQFRDLEKYCDYKSIYFNPLCLYDTHEEEFTKEFWEYYASYRKRHKFSMLENFINGDVEDDYKQLEFDIPPIAI